MYPNSDDESLSRYSRPIHPGQTFVSAGAPLVQPACLSFDRDKEFPPGPSLGEMCEKSGVLISDVLYELRRFLGHVPDPGTCDLEILQDGTVLIGGHPAFQVPVVYKQESVPADWYAAAVKPRTRPVPPKVAKLEAQEKVKAKHRRSNRPLLMGMIRDAEAELGRFLTDYERHRLLIHGEAPGE